VTLVFLGQTPASDVPAVWDAVPDGVRAPRLTPTGLLALPRRRPHVFALGLEEQDGRAAALQRGIAGTLGVGEGRPWLPHVTLARVRKGQRVSRLADDPPRVDPFDAPAVSLLRSHPGSRYEVVERAELGAQSS
jgi:2'-5' RNA ligase